MVHPAGTTCVICRRWLLPVVLLLLIGTAGMGRCESTDGGRPDRSGLLAADPEAFSDGDVRWPILAIGAMTGMAGIGIALIVVWRGRQKARLAFRRSEDRFHQITRSMGEVLWLGSADFTTLEYVNYAYETIWGRRRQQLYDHPSGWFDSIFPHDTQAVKAFFAGQKNHRRDGDSGIEFRIVRPDGEIRWIHARRFPILADSDEVPRVVGIGRDITRRKFFEASLREAEEKWRSLMENSPDHIMLMDLDGHILFANREFMGIERPALVGKSLVSLLSPDVEPVVGHCLKAVAATAASQICRVEGASGDGDPAYFELRMGPVSINAKTVAVAVNSTEVTDRVISEDALRQSEAFHRTIFNDTPTGIAIQDFSAVEDSVRALYADGVSDLRAYLMARPDEVSRLAGEARIVQANPAIEDLYHSVDLQTIVGPLSRILMEGDRTHFIDQVVDFTSGKDRYEGEARNIDFTGRTLHLILRKVVIQREINGLSKILTVLIDVTPLKTAEKERQRLMLQLQQAQKMEAIGTLAGGVAHDFNNILSIILGNAELLLSDMTTDDPLRSNIQEIERAIMRARDIVRQLLELSRHDNQKLEPVHLIPVIVESVKFLRATLPANIAIHSDLAAVNDVTRADATQIHQIMINLFTNAGHAMEDRGGDLWVRAENVTLNGSLQGPVHNVPAGNYIRVSVCDTGSGIPDEIRDRIFDPYFTTKAAGKGSGMGLAMVHGIMQNFGGGIVLDTAVGRGTMFELYFPLADLPAPRPPVEMKSIPGGSERILCVDDEAIIVNLHRKMLTRLGYRVDTFTDPAAALSMISASMDGIDLIITDMAMPVMTGDRFVEAVRQLQPKLPVILCTGYRDRISEKTVKWLNISMVLDKPVELKQLATAIRNVLDGDPGSG